MTPLTVSDVTWFDITSETRVGRAGGDVIVEWPGLLRMIASPSMERAHVNVLGELDENLVKKADGFARALPAYLRGAVVFHAAAVAAADSALLILGESGAGKSTTAALLCDAGATLIADDTALGVLQGDKLLLQPLETDHWLDESARTALARDANVPGKRPVAGPPRHAPTKLVAAVLLEPCDVAHVRTTRMRGLDSAAALLKSALRLPLDTDRSKRDLDVLAQIARYVPVYRALRPREFSSNLKELPSALLELLECP